MIPTAKEFYDVHYSDDVVIMMRDYAKLHVEAALKAALEDAPYGSSTDTVSYKDMKDSILNAYPLSNIK
jgi:hypothetical protein